MITRVRQMFAIDRVGEADDTVGQAKCPTWLEHRSFFSTVGPRISSTRAHSVANKKKTTSWFPSLSRWVTGAAINTPAILHGIQNEPIALAAYKVYIEGETNKKVKKGRSRRKKKPSKSEPNEVHQTGTWIDKEHPFMSASPDALVGNDGTVEIKC